jgi:hypothetical protein
MPPKETDHLLLPLSQQDTDLSDDNSHHVTTTCTTSDNNNKYCVSKRTDEYRSRVIMIVRFTIASIVIAATIAVAYNTYRSNLQHNQQQQHTDTDTTAIATGPYTIIKEVQEGNDFWNYYNFYNGNDTLGSAGYNTYVNASYAQQHELIRTIPAHEDDNDTRGIIYMQSKPTSAGPRESIRIEGKTRFMSNTGGLFILDLDHIPAGCGQWPAFWLTDTDHWPNNGEIDIVEGINTQNVVKTALHTSDRCNMYAHVPSYKMTGKWDRATGIPDTYTGIMDYNTSIPADNCYVMASHQWMNQGCVIESTEDNTIGNGLNQIGRGGIFVLQWDPIVTKSIQSYVFLKSKVSSIPNNLIDSIQYASYMNHNKRNGETQQQRTKTTTTTTTTIPKEVYPDPQGWGETILPYAYFAIGNTTGCSSDHFNHMNLIFNLAFCGNVAGNRFYHDCPHIQPSQSTSRIKTKTNEHNTIVDPIQACNEYIASQPDELQEAFWAIRGVYVYERSTME